MVQYFSQNKIRTRILLALLLLTLLSLLFLAAVSLFGMKSLGNTATELNEGLGQEVLRVSKNAMQNLARDGILRITADQADILDSEFRGVENQVILLATLAGTVWHNLDSVPLRTAGKAAAARGGDGVSTTRMQGLTGTTVIDQPVMAMLKGNPFVAGFSLATPAGALYTTTLVGTRAMPDPRRLEWYSRAVSTGKSGWSPPFLDPVSNSPRISCSTPLRNRHNRIIAVLAIDIDLRTINNRILRAQLSNQGVALLLDHTRKVISRAGSSADLSGEQAEYFTLQGAGEEQRRLGDDLLAGKSGISRGIYRDRESLVAYAPVATTKWSVLLILPVEDVNAPIRPTERSISSQLKMVQTQVNTKISLSLVILAFCFVIMIGVVVVVARRVAGVITAPIIRLEEGVKIIGEGNLDHRLEVHSGDEIEKLADSFNKMTTDLQSYIRNLTETMAAKERIEGELKVATDIQASLLPRIFPPFPDRPELDLFAMMDPAKEVGGDFYDFFFIDDTHLFFLIADVSDKGVPAALFMMVSKTLLKTEALRCARPDEILSRVNSQLYPDNETMMFVTIYCAILNTETGELQYSNAGHNPPLLRRRDGSTGFISVPPGLVVGAMEGSTYGTYSLQLEEDDIILLYTDGVTEAMNGEGHLYGEDRLVASFSGNAASEVQDFIGTIRDDILVFTDGAKQSDDITMLAVRFVGSGQAGSNRGK